MSRNNTNNAYVKKFCKVCQDSGKSEEVYRSHFTRETPDPNSKVICPTLLALECRYCYKNGHTVKYCPCLKEKAYYEKKNYFVKHIEPSKKSNESNATKKTFDHLVCEDFDEEEKLVTLTKKSVSFLQNDIKERISQKFVETLKEDSFLISNYAFSEIPMSIQNMYSKYVLNPFVSHGFLTWNFIDIYNFIENKYFKIEEEYPLTGYKNKYIYLK